jgi:transglutaminase/protease-like cytokinesis protein 3
MRKIFLFIFLLGFWSEVIAQHNPNYATIDKIMKQIPESMTNSTSDISDYINSKFSTSGDKSRAIFIWIATNIQYDIANMFTLRADLNPAEIVDRTLKKRKGVCINYAELFNELANKVGIKSYVISGYTKQSGIIDKLPHAWCVALIDSEWFMFDPTWGSGTIENAKFIKQINDDYCKAKPEYFINSHMPFDPLWQFLTFPVTYQAFYENKTQLDRNEPYFNFKDSLSVYDNQSEIERLISSRNRIEKNTGLNSLVLERLQYIKRKIVYYQNNQFDLQYNAAITSFNNGISLLNIFSKYYNKQFRPLKSDSEIQQMIDTVEICFKNTRQLLSNIKNPDTNTAQLIKQMNKSVDDALLSVEERKAFLVKYFNTNTLYRKSLFYK